MGEQTVKKHKFKKWRKPGIRMQVMLGFVLFTAVIVTLLWTFQITLLNTFYKAIKVNEVAQRGEPCGGDAGRKCLRERLF